MSEYDQVFAKHITADANFDMMFGADEDNELMSTVLGEEVDMNDVDDKTCTCGVENKDGGMKDYDPTDHESKGAEAPKDDSSDVSPLGKTDTYKQSEVIKAGDGSSADPESINDTSEKFKGQKEFEYQREGFEYTSMLEEEIDDKDLKDDVNFNGVEDKTGGMKSYDPTDYESKGAASPDDDTSDVSALGKTDTYHQKNVVENSCDSKKGLDCPEHIEDGIEKFKGEDEFEYKRESADNFEQAYNNLMLELGLDPDQPIDSQEEPADTQSDDLMDVVAPLPASDHVPPVDNASAATPEQNHTDLIEDDEYESNDKPANYTDELEDNAPSPEELAADEDEDDIYESSVDNDLFFSIIGEASPKELEKLDDQIAGTESQEDKDIEKVDDNNVSSPYSASELNEDDDDDLIAAVLGK